MRKGMWKETAKRLASIFLAGMILAATVVTPVSAVHTYYWPDAVTADAMAIKNWTWTAEGEEAARNPSVGLVPTGFEWNMVLAQLLRIITAGNGLDGRLYKQVLVSGGKG